MISRKAARMSQQLSRCVATLTRLSSEHESFFHYNSGRWLYNERQQLAAREVQFNVDALKQVAASAAGAKRCVSMVKSNEGSFNRIFTLKFDNGSEVIAKIPCPLVTPQHICTASEVATMEYARTILGLPIPKVLDWSARADGTSVGVEYILMEKIEGVELSHRYKNFREEGINFVYQVNSIEQSFVSRRFSQIGSLYFKEDVEPALQARPLYAEGEGVDDASERFRIGPYVDWSVWRGARADLALDRGPWSDALSFVQAIINIQQAWLKRFAPVRSANDVFSFSGLDTSPDIHVRLLDQVLALTPYLLPPDNLSFPVLWHTDLHGGNIMIKAEGAPDITGIIDWQGMSVAPLFIQCVYPKFVKYTGDDRIVLPPGLKLPELPPDFDQYSEDEQTFIKGQYRLAIFYKSYEASIAYNGPHQLAIHGYPDSDIDHLKVFVGSSSRTWFDGAHHLFQYLLEVEENWDEIAPGTAFPVCWHKQDIEQHYRDYARLEVYDDCASRLMNELQIEGNGWVSNERYGEVRAKCDELQRSWDVDKNGGPFPFQDGAPFDILS
ncbi:hypothetical protein AZE42_02813 [Rhizopogon vesiculosus]|uniref:Aminoglycoside phosphotransferase domain-containing protein n=1 Tax=Rhizopogon vesiculosus TaxID=180088 RepID=A0A1J8RD49_9AGAM|nr:hypothetical protein AZE42_02813 [Rhizopogon vesiculosus]